MLPWLGYYTRVQTRHEVPIGDKWLGTGEELEVRSPYDGEVLGSVPSCGAEEVDAAVAAAKARLEDPQPTHQRAAILDRAAALLDERQDEFARTIAAEAAKPLRTARVEAARAVDTFRFSAAEARTLTGDVVPLEASSSSSFFASAL